MWKNRVTALTMGVAFFFLSRWGFPVLFVLILLELLRRCAILMYAAAAFVGPPPSRRRSGEAPLSYR
jgi:hypothetical protein